MSYDLVIRNGTIVDGLGGEPYVGDVAIADVNGIPYVAWIEGDGTNDEVRVARPTADGAGWEEVGTGRNAASPINWNASRNAAEVAELIVQVLDAEWMTGSVVTLDGGLSL